MKTSALIALGLAAVTGLVVYSTKVTTPGTPGTPNVTPPPAGETLDQRYARLVAAAQANPAAVTPDQLDEMDLTAAALQKVGTPDALAKAAALVAVSNGLRAQKNLPRPINFAL